MVKEVFLPKLSDNMEAGVIIAWLAKDGDRVDKGQPILEVETDKATVELEAPESGILRGIRPGVEPGATVPVGTTIAFVAETPDEPVPSLSFLSGAQAPMGGVPEDLAGERLRPTISDASATTGQVRATPVARRIARERGVDLEQVRGTGPGGRVTEGDIYAFDAKSAPDSNTRPPLPLPSTVDRGHAPAANLPLSLDHQLQTRSTDSDHLVGGISTEGTWSPTGAAVAVGTEHTADGDWVELTRMQQVTGQRMYQSVQTAPQFALTISVDMTRLLELREEHSGSIEGQASAAPSVTGILIKIVADALHECRRLNASFVAGRVLLHRQVNIGVAVATDEGLLVPVIRDADKKSLVEITRELSSLQEKSRLKRFKPGDLGGGTFTISNLGMFGIDKFHAIINPPESAILAVGRIIKMPIGMPDESIALRPMMSLTLTIDHRCLDGKQGADFLLLLKQGLERPDQVF